MTYGECIDYLQTTLKGRKTLGKWKDYVVEKKCTKARFGRSTMTEKDFSEKRDKQIRQLYNQYMLEKGGTRPLFFLSGSTLIRDIQRILGEDVILDAEDIGFVHEISEWGDARTSIPDYKLLQIVDNMCAIKSCIEYSTGRKVLTIPLCRETQALREEIRIAKDVYDLAAYEASLRDRGPRKEWLSQLFSKLKDLSRQPVADIKLEDQQIPVNGDGEAK